MVSPADTIARPRPTPPAWAWTAGGHSRPEAGSIILATGMLTTCETAARPGSVLSAAGAMSSPTDLPSASSLRRRPSVRVFPSVRIANTDLPRRAVGTPPGLTARVDRRR